MNFPIIEKIIETLSLNAKTNIAGQISILHLSFGIIFVLIVGLVSYYAGRSIQHKASPNTDIAVDVEKISAKVARIQASSPSTEDVISLQSVVNKLATQKVSEAATATRTPLLKTLQNLESTFSRVREDENEDGNSNGEAWFELVEEIITIDFDKMLSELDSSLAAAAKLPATHFNNTIKLCQEHGLPEAAVRQHLISPAKGHLEAQTLQSRLRSDASSLTSKLHKLEARRQAIERIWPELKEELDSSFSLADFAKGAGAGVLAIVNPFIGIPALLGLFGSSHVSDKRRQAKIERFFETVQSQVKDLEKAESLSEKSAATTEETMLAAWETYSLQLERIFKSNVANKLNFKGITSTLSSQKTTSSSKKSIKEAS